MKNLLISEQVDLIKIIKDLLIQDKEGLSKNIIVFPGRRPAHFLRKYLSDTIKLPYKSPLIFSIDDFIDFLYDSLGYIDRKITEIDGIAIIYQLNKEIKFVENKENELKFDEFFQFGFKIYQDLEEMCIELIEEKKIKAVDLIITEKLPHKIKERITILSDLYEGFYNYLSANKLSTRASRYKKVSEEINKLNFYDYKNIILAGFFALSNSELKIFEELNKKENVIIIFQKGPYIEDTIKKLNIEPEEKEGSDTEPEIKFYTASDLHSEIFMLNKLINEKEKFSFKDLIVIPSSDTLLPLLHNTISLINDDYNISLGYPLFNTPIYTLIKTLAELIETKENDNYFTYNYLKFVLHPYIKNIYFDTSAADITRIIFHTIETELIKKDKKFVKLSEIEEDDNILFECRKILEGYLRQDSAIIGINEEKIKNHIKNIHLTLIEPFDEIINVEDFIDKILKFIEFISQKSTAKFHPYTLPFINKITESLYELKTAIIKDEKFTEASNYFRLLRNYLKTIHYPFKGTPVKGLQILGLLEVRNLKFDTIYFLDVNEGIIPHTKKEDTILPNEIRKYLELPTYKDREKISKYYFYTLISSAKEVNIFYIENENKEKSRFVEELIWLKQKKNKTLELPEGVVNEVFFDVNFSQKETKGIKKTEELLQYIKEKIIFSSSNLDNYLCCPIKFYYQDVLKLKEKEELFEEVEQIDIGLIVHKILKEFFTKKIKKKLSIENRDYKIIDWIVEEVFKEKYPYQNEGEIYFIKLQVKRRMKDLLRFYTQKYNDIEIIDCEKVFNSIITLPSNQQVKIEGRIDRIDKRQEKYYIIDYKTGGEGNTPTDKFNLSEREKWYKTLKSVQLPLYTLIYLENNKDISIKNIHCGVVLLGKKEIEEKFLFKNEISEKRKQEMFENYKKAITTLIEEVLNPQIEFEPTLFPQENCPRCIFRLICGKQWLKKKFLH